MVFILCLCWLSWIVRLYWMNHLQSNLLVNSVLCNHMPIVKVDLISKLLSCCKGKGSPFSYGLIDFIENICHSTCTTLYVAFHIFFTPVWNFLQDGKGWYRYSLNIMPIAKNNEFSVWSYLEDSICLFLIFHYLRILNCGFVFRILG